jgi:hypothetical protein
MTSISDTSTTPSNSDAIQRVLFIASTVHIYSIPPLTTTKGYHAASWTADSNKRRIFTARLRIVENAIPHADDSGESLSTDILLEDPASGQLFAAAPYTDVGVVEAALDSSRFFAVRVVGEGGRKAVLGVGFEERSEAIDFRIALQEVQKVHGMVGWGVALSAAPKKETLVEKKDFSLKDGEMIHVDIGRKARKKVADEGYTDDILARPPPPYVERAGPAGTMPFLPPPPSAQDVKAQMMSFPPPPSSAQDIKGQRRRSRQKSPPKSSPAIDTDFDDGEFGEFQ